jgi:phage gp36-like protein
MAFLTDTDYNVQIRTEVTAIIAAQPGAKALAEQMAEAEMISYLKPRGYDVVAIFAAIGANRNPLIIMYLIDMVLYHLHANVATRAMPKVREDRYNAAIAWLDKVSKGMLEPDLPALETPEDSTPTLQVGSNTKYFKRW